MFLPGDSFVCVSRHELFEHLDSLIEDNEDDRQRNVDML